MSHFYRELAAMETRLDRDDHVVLEVEGLQLVVHGLAGEPKPDEPVRVREDTYVKVCLPVSSITAARAAAASLGGSVKPPEAEWEARGFRACDGHDPEGNVFQVRESAR